MINPIAELTSEMKKLMRDARGRYFTVPWAANALGLRRNTMSQKCREWYEHGWLMRSDLASIEVKVMWRFIV